MSNFLSELKRDFSELKKYKFNIFFAYLQMLFIFLGLTEYIFVEDREVIFYMLIIWYFATHGLAVPTYIIEEEILDQTIINIIQSRTSLFLRLLSKDR